MSSKSIYTLSKLCKFIRIVNKVDPLLFTIQYLFNYVLHVFISYVCCVNCTCHLCTSVNWLWDVYILIVNKNKIFFLLYIWILFSFMQRVLIIFTQPHGNEVM
jgi:hypothetical protein